MRTGPRRRVAPAIYADDRGFEARAHAAGATKSRRFPPRTALRDMKAWQADARKALRQDARARRHLLAPGTLAGDIAAVLEQLPADDRRHRRADFLAWVTPTLGPALRRDVTLEELRAVVLGWLETGVAASTIHHRRRALIAVYETLDGPEPPVLPRRLKRPRQPTPQPRAVPMPVLEAVIATMPDHPYPNRPHRRSRPKAICRVLLWTGTPPAVLRLMTPHSVDLEAKEITKPARAKGRGAPAVTLPLVEPQGVEAARDWLRAQAWGRFDTRTVARAFRRAVQAYRRAGAPAGPVPPDVRLYDLRHSFLTWLARTTGNPLVVQQYGQLVDLATARRYMLGAVPDMVRAAIRAAGRGTPSPEPPASR